MTTDPDDLNLDIARAWCEAKGEGWSVVDTAGRGGTAPVFTVSSPNGPLALKLLDEKFSQGEMGQITETRIGQQVALGEHDCPYVVKIFDGGRFNDRLFLLMNKAEGRELEKCLSEIPRAKIRSIVDQVARACIFLRRKGLCHRDIKSANVFISDDFNRATLLDLSVIREISDPVGIGTDHDGQLPVVATSRYTPPEYLFRLIEPSPELWHAVDVYQLGGILHDLVMQYPMFEEQYQLSKENRYRFAWIVATQDPVVEAADVDQDLIALARRALDKDWQRRTSLSLENFLMDQENIRVLSFEALGLGAKPRPSSPQPTQTLHNRSLTRARAVEQLISAKLSGQGVTATHETSASEEDFRKVLTFEWEPPANTSSPSLAHIKLTCHLALADESMGSFYEIDLRLEALVNDRVRKVEIKLPSVRDDAEAASLMADAVFHALPDLAERIMRNEENVGAM